MTTDSATPSPVRRYLALALVGVIGGALSGAFGVGGGIVMVPLLIWLAKHVGGAIGRTTWAQRAWLRQQRDLRFGSADVRLRV